ncbi:MAG: phosphopantetheine-binding protein [Thermoanaerobaculia bacterium]
MDDRKSKIRQFVAKFLRGHQLEDGEDFFRLGFNSLFALQLVQFVEKEFAITIDDDDLDIDNFRTVDAVAALVERKTES